MTQAMEVDVGTKTALAEESPATPAKGNAVGKDEKASRTDGSASQSEPTGQHVETPPKTSQADAEMIAEGEQEEDDENEAVGVQLYYVLLRMLFKELELYANNEAGLLDPKKQMLVYHHAARLHELRADVLGALNGDLGMTANLPAKYQKALRKLRKKLQESGQLDGLQALTEHYIFEHEHAIRFMEGTNLPTGAQECCVFIREKPHAKSDNVKQISPFRDVIKFNCNQNPLLQMEDSSMGLALTVEKIHPVAYMVVSPFLRKPELLPPEDAMSSWSQIEGLLRDHLIDFVAKDTEGWRGFVQRRANIVSKGSLTIIQRVLRMRPRTEGLEAAQLTEIQDLQAEVEELRERARKAEEIVTKRIGDTLAKDNASLEDKLFKVEKELAEVTGLSERLHIEKGKVDKELDDMILAGSHLEERCTLLEQSSLTKGKQVEDLERENSVLRDCADDIECRLRGEFESEKEKLEGKLAKEIETKNSELELMSCGVQEMLVELRRNQTAKKQALEREERLKAQFHTKKNELEAKFQSKEKDVEAKFESKKTELEAKFQSKEKEAEAALKSKESELAGATERAVEAERKELVAKASLQVKTETVETLTASNVTLRAEAAAAKAEVEKAAESLATTEHARKEAVERETQARSDLEVMLGEIECLRTAVGESKAFASAARDELSKATADREKAEQTALEASATLQVKTEEATALTATCTSLTVENDKLTQAVRQEVNRVSELEQGMTALKAQNEQGMTALKAQLELKESTLESLTASNAALRAEASIAKDSAEKAFADRDDARKNEAEANQKLQCELDTNAKLRTDIEAAEKMKKEAEDTIQLCREEVAVQLLLKEKAEENAAQARINEAKASATYQVKADEASSLFNECASLRAEIAKVNERADLADERASTAQTGEMAAKASLQLKSEEVDRIVGLNVELRAEMLKSQGEKEEADKRAAAAEKSVEAANRARDQAYAELRGKITALEAMTAKMSSVRSEAAAIAKAEGKAEAETAAKKALKEAEEQANSALQRASESERSEKDALARIQVKSDEAARLTEECSDLRAEIAVLREKCEASAGVVKALSSSYEKMKKELAAKPPQMVFLPEYSSAGVEAATEDLAVGTAADSELGITLEDLNTALTQDIHNEHVKQSEIAGASCGRRIRHKAPQPQPITSDDATRLETSEASVENASLVTPTASAVGSARTRLRSKTAVENSLQKRPKTADEREATDAD